MTARTVLIATDAKEVKLVTAFNTLLDKLNAAGVAVDNYIAERTAEELASNIEVGQTVKFLFGRAAGRVEEQGTVAAVVPTPAGKLLKVIVDTGLPTMRIRDVRLKDATVVGAEGTCKGAECTAVTGTDDHSAACQAEHSAVTDAGVDLDAALALVTEPVAAAGAVDVDALIANL
jgi:hypothetical protein